MEEDEHQLPETETADAFPVFRLGPGPDPTCAVSRGISVTIESPDGSETAIPGVRGLVMRLGPPGPPGTGEEGDR